MAINIPKKKMHRLRTQICRIVKLDRSHSSITQFPAVKKCMLPPDTFSNKTAVVTGGGTGLGKGIAQQLSVLGARVAICSR